MKAKRYLAERLALTAFFTLSLVGWLNFTYVRSLLEVAVAAGNHQFSRPNAVTADLALTMTDLPDPSHSDTVYTLSVVNNGPDEAADVIVTDTLAAGQTLLIATSAQGSCTGSAPITCNLGALAARAQATVTITARAAAPGAYINRAQVTSATPDSNTDNNTATEETRRATTVSIYGRVTLANGAGLSGVTVTSGNPQKPPVTTRADGAYQFADLPFGGTQMYTLTPSLPGYVFNPPSQTRGYLNGDNRADFTAVQCAYTVTPLSHSFSATGGTGTVTLTATAPQCPWAARSNASWLTITSATSGTGNATVTFTVAPATSARHGTLIIANQVVTVRQEFNACPLPAFQTPPLLFPDGVELGSPPRFLLSDFNLDGRADLLLRISGSGLPVYFSNSSGGYDAPQRLLPPPFSPGNSVVGDFNRDNKPDLAAIIADRVVVLLNNTTTPGTGSFAAPMETLVSAPLSELRDGITGDFNEDGNLDLFVTAVSGFPPMRQNVVVLPGNGAGGFGAPILTAIPPTPNSIPYQLARGDFDGDRRTDVAVANPIRELYVLRGNGDGRFTIVPVLPAIRLTYTPDQLTTGDFNGDQRSDLVILRRSQSATTNREVAIYLANEADGFQEPLVRQLSPEVGIGGLLTDDLNGDGRSEMLVLNRSGVEVVTTSLTGVPNAPVGYFTGAVREGASPDGRQSFATGDFNGDGRPDLFIPLPVGTLAYASALTVLVARADGSLIAPRSFPLLTEQPPGLLSSTITGLDDFNGDGITDLVIRTLRQNAHELIVRFSDGQGGFSAQTTLAIAIEALILAGVDFNRDNRLDIATFESSTGVLTVHVNMGANNFAARAAVRLESGMRLLATGDFNNDHNPDLLLATSSSARLLIGNGAAGFTERPVSLPAELNNATFRTGDFNGDGNLDLVAWQSSVLLGDGQGNFATTVSQVPFGLGLPRATGDFNLDGRTDLAFLTGPPPVGLHIALSRGNGRFGTTDDSTITPNSIVSTRELRSLVSGDFNGDGVLDLIAGSADNSGALVLAGKGDGSFMMVTTLPLPATNNINLPPLIAPGDFNGDGATDLLLASTLGAGRGAFVLNQGGCLAANGLAVTSAASFSGLRVAPSSIAAAFGNNLAAEVRSAATVPLPTTLGDTSVQLKDAAGVEHNAPLFFVAPGQINLLIPPGVASGPAVLNIRRGSNTLARGVIEVAPVSPGLFAADASGRGLAAAVVLRVKADGTQIFEPVAQFDAAQNRFQPMPIDVSDANEQVFLLLFGTGLRGRSSLSAVTATINDALAEVLHAGAQGGFAGLDQINLRLLPNLAGQGLVEIKLTVDGRAANTVNVSIR